MDTAPTSEEFAALSQALADAMRRSDEVAGELRVVRTERDLLKEQLNKFKRQHCLRPDNGAAQRSDRATLFTESRFAAAALCVSRGPAAGRAS